MHNIFILGAALLISTSVTLGIDSRARAAGEPAWNDALQSVDNAIAAGDAGEAQRAFLRAYAAAIGSRRWEAMLAVGDAARRVADVNGARASGIQWARRCYLTALFRARDARALDGVVDAVERFARLGDRDTVTQGLRMADAMARQRADAGGLTRVRALAERIGEHPMVSGDLRAEP